MNIHKTIKLGFLLCTLAPWTSWGQRNGYTMADLEALEAQRSYKEFLEHAHDVRPSERGSAWTKMVSEMASGLIDFNLTRSRVSREEWLFLDKISVWPALRTDEFFTTKLANYFRAYVPVCLNHPELTKQQCSEDILRFWRNSPRDPDLGIWLAEHNHTHLLGLPQKELLERTGTGALAQYYCARPLVQDFHVSSLLSEMSSKVLAEEQVLNLLNARLGPECWAQLKHKFKEVMSSMEARSSLAEHAFRILHLKGEIEQDEADLFLVRYILSGPVVGPVFTMAWNRVALLGQNFSRRELVFGKLSQMDHLPDRLFASANQDSVRIILEHFNRHFPEFVPFYARTCLSYYEGSKVFPRGNPTLYCDQFFALTGQQRMIDQTLQIQYSGVKKAR
jgi:hypothetical protein